MNYCKIVPALLLVAVLVLAAPGLVRANSLPLPDQPQADLGTGFTYQGYLTDGGAPAEGIYDFEFRLYSVETGGLDLGRETLGDVSVTNGYFTVLIDFGASAFNGQARWLEIGVRPGAETGAYTTLTPRQALSAAPYAMYASTSPWAGLSGVPAGFADGTDADTTYTAGTGLSLTGGAFSVNFGGSGTAVTASRSDHDHSNFWRINGNSQTDPATNYIGTMDDAALVFRVNAQPALRLEPNATSPNLIGGNSGNSVTAGMYGATISGGGSSGSPNRVTGHYGTVGGGNSNEASGETSTVGGGENNTAGGDTTVVGGGYLNAASGYIATVGGGNSNDASGDASTVAGGSQNEASGYIATVGGGETNTASGSFSTVPGGRGAEAWQYGQMAYASGSFGASGDAQASLYVLRNTSTGTAWTELFLNGTYDRLNLATDQAVAFDILIVGSTDAGESAGYRIQGLIENIGGVTALIGTPSVTVLGEDDTAWNVQVLADNTNDALLIEVMGNSETIRWVASVQTAEVTFP